ncbi:MAG TPA: serine hydroxymethyltransferase [Herpetosiphonaceae bacterium]
MSEPMLSTFAEQGVDLLRQDDPELYGLLADEHQRQMQTLVLVASCSVTHPSVLACEGMVAANVTAEGYPGKRYHAGCEFIDGIERLAIQRAKTAFSAQFANLQAHSATTANYLVMASLLRPGDTILGMELQFGGHLTHGSKAAFAGQYFNAIGYGLDAQERIDFAQVAELAHQHRPRLIICGATAYPRTIDFARFRAIADEVGALLLADISHTAGLVVSGLHPSPIDHAHITTTCTHKQLYGPRGGLILMGRDHAQPAPGGKHTLAESIQRGLFPFFQGAPLPHTIAAKGRALDIAMSAPFKQNAARIVEDARALASGFIERGYRVVTGGTDNHIVLLNVAERGLSGLIAERALEESGIMVNKNRLPGDTKSAVVSSGVRLGTNTAAYRGLGPTEMEQCVALIDRVLSSVEALDDQRYRLDSTVRDAVQAEVRQLCERFPIASYDLAAV